MSKDYDDSAWVSKRVLLSGEPSTPTELYLHYIDCRPPASTNIQGLIILIHGYPQTSYQFRHVITPLSLTGYRIIAPDYRGAGHSSRPRDGYNKMQMAADIHQLVTGHLKFRQPAHVVGHDIGGMIAHAYAVQFPSHTASVAWGECPLPGTQVYDEIVKNDRRVWHFDFHMQIDLPELLTQGRERIYIKHFYDRLCINARAITPKE
eukprot:TRINITY_DN3618_c0_g1_i2.p1 TRINITY_DN3618_c0_g1~~TRINITY_DN3618_c0_g1_i2.p1  ORF type:complete len:206 (+),score=17.52 TRINITY_DN3618_c0_g1_i2:80-697(+)